MASPSRPSDVSRREFLQYVAAGAAGAAGTAAGAWVLWEVWLKSIFPRQRSPLNAWELDYGVVDYNVVLEEQYGPAQLGFANDIRQSPLEARILNVAQWYDYWPGKVLNDFSAYMDKVWGVKGVKVSWTSNIYTSNDELVSWVLGKGRTFDVMFPTDFAVERLEKAGALANMNKAWIPNYVNIFGKVPPTFPEGFDPYRPDLVAQPGYPSYPNGYNNAAGVDFRTPALNGHAYRMNRDVYPNPRGAEYFTWNEENSLLAVPYQWGTTGIAYRTDIFWKEDIEAMGWEVFELADYQGTSLTGKKMMLGEMREVFAAALKAVGWKRQVAFKEQGLTTAEPTAIVRNTGPTRPPGGTPPTYGDPPFNGEFQWSANEVADERLQAAVQWLQSLPGLWGFNTAQQGPFLVSGVMYVDHAWSGDTMYAIRPASNLHLPVDFFLPNQGTTWWVDNAVIDRASAKLWLAHEFINFLCDAGVGATISNWNFYATPNAWSFELLAKDPQYTYYGVFPDGSSGYVWNPAADQRIYADLALGIDGQPMPGGYLGNGGDPLLERCERLKDLGLAGNLKYARLWEEIQ